VLFDFNGVLVEDERWHWRAFRAVLEPRGLRLSWSDYTVRYLAFDDASMCRALLRDAGWPAARRSAAVVKRLVAAKRRRFRRLCVEHSLGIRPETARLVRALSRRRSLAVVSGAARIEILSALRRAGLRSCFSVIVAIENVRRGKPDPEGYRRALRRLGCAPGAPAMAVEDSPGGIAAARAAGLRVLGVATTYPAATLRRAGAFAVIPVLRPGPRVSRLLGQKAS
jgi:beta-phosphoglucomutase